MSEITTVEITTGIPSKLDHSKESTKVSRNSVLLEQPLPRELSTRQCLSVVELNGNSPNKGSRNNSPSKMSHRANGTSSAGQTRQQLQINPPTLIEFEKFRFLIADAPSNNNLIHYIKEFEKYNVTDVVRVCDPTYNVEPLQERSIQVHDWVFGDGEPPPAKIVSDWLNLVEKRFFHDNTDENEGPAIACHCVAGLGRAPVLVAIALIEAGMKPLDSVSYIRERRRGAINKKQLKYIESYKRRARRGCIIC